MHHDRLQGQLESYRLPRKPVAAPSPAGFLCYPVSLFQGMTAGQWLAHQWIYQAAYEQAQAVVRPSILERDLLAVWN